MGVFRQPPSQEQILRDARAFVRHQRCNAIAGTKVRNTELVLGLMKDETLRQSKRTKRLKMRRQKKAEKIEWIMKMPKDQSRKRTDVEEGL